MTSLFSSLGHRTCTLNRKGYDDEAAEAYLYFFFLFLIWNIGFSDGDNQTLVVNEWKFAFPNSIVNLVIYLLFSFFARQSICFSYMTSFIFPASRVQ